MPLASCFFKVMLVCLCSAQQQLSAAGCDNVPLLPRPCSNSIALLVSCFHSSGMSSSPGPVASTAATSLRVHPAAPGTLPSLLTRTSTGWRPGGGCPAARAWSRPRLTSRRCWPRSHGEQGHAKRHTGTNHCRVCMPVQAGQHHACPAPTCRSAATRYRAVMVSVCSVKEVMQPEGQNSHTSQVKGPPVSMGEPLQSSSLAPCMDHFKPGYPATHWCSY